MAGSAAVAAMIGAWRRRGLRVGTNMGKPRVLLADDHTLVVEAFTKLLEPQFEIVGTAGDGRALLEKAVQLQPDVVLLDLSMPILNGFEAGERLKKLLPRAKLIVLTMTEDAEVAADVLHSWASGFLLKKSASAELVRAIQDVLRGKTFVTSHLAQNLLDKFVRDPLQKSKTLTPRQREVLQLLAEGRTMKEVADVLNVTPRTVAFHKYKIMEEFELKTNSDLLRFAMKERLVTRV
jgi:DNA-binding NarL/FixJ family response regulator